MESIYFTSEERKQITLLYKRLFRLSGDTLQKDDCRKLKDCLIKAYPKGEIPRNCFGMNSVIKSLQTSIIIAEEIGMKRASVLGIMLHEPVQYGMLQLNEIEESFGSDVAGIIRGLVRINELYAKSPTIESENFRNLLLSFAEDMRVILIMIADRVNLMRQIKDAEDDEARQRISYESAYLYAPLAHKLGLYKLKSELEDLSLKYTEKEVYYHIKEKLNATKAARDKYRSYPAKTGRGRLEVSHERAHQVHSLHLSEDEETEMSVRRRIRPFCYPHHPRFAVGKGETGMLAGLFHHYGYVYAQSEALARLAQCAQEQWLRILAHHCHGA